ncbi:MAG: putative toxin-antitoxin system toxin component, PIN family [Gracilimonas sp.]|nr:putative toxin-antitoxin system toxin component, PIN family [Gracilimonas sp.]
MRLILDTNLWISFLISSDFQKLDEILLKENCSLLFSEELISEFVEVIRRPKLKEYIKESDLDNIFELINEFGEFITVTSVIAKCRDPKDNFLLSLAIDGNADYLLTGDKDLLVLENIGNAKIIQISQFQEILE